jgi:Protein of unknown function (DUF1376)
MVAWYKHDIPAWMDGTEALEDGAYRAYHVVCQLIYLNEGPIALNEHGIAGRCRQSIKSFRANLSKLIAIGKLQLSDDRLSNSRAVSELENVAENRVNASKGGKKPRKPPIEQSKPLEINNSGQASLQETSSLIEKTREEKTREEDTLPSVALHAGGRTRSEPALILRAPDDWPAEFRVQFWDRYPNKVGKPKALNKLELARRRGVKWCDVIAGLDTYIRDKPPDRQWLNPETFINQERWADQPATVSTANGTGIQKTESLSHVARRHAEAGISFGERPTASGVRLVEGGSDVRLLSKGGSE